jgi:hypothetical protein
LYVVELDALLAIEPDEFKSIVQGSVHQFFDTSIYQNVLSDNQQEKVDSGFLESNIVDDSELIVKFHCKKQSHREQSSKDVISKGNTVEYIEQFEPDYARVVLFLKTKGNVEKLDEKIFEGPHTAQKGIVIKSPESYMDEIIKQGENDFHIDKDDFKTVTSKPKRVPSATLKIFVSYSRSDAGDFAEATRKHLTGFDYIVFIDTNSINAGEIWNDINADYISNCDIFVVIITPGVLISPHVEREVLQAKREKKRIIPCVHRHVARADIKRGLEKIQGINFDSKYDLVRDLHSKINQLRVT